MSARAALDRAHAMFFRTQQEDGSWSGPCDQGPAATGQALVGLRFVEALAPADAEAAARYLVRQQRPDGSFAGYPFAERGDLSATACAWAGLTAAGLPVDHDAVRRARAFVEANGGFPEFASRVQQGDLTALFVVLAKLAPADALVPPPVLFTLLPPLERFVERRFNVQMPFVLLLTGVLLHYLRGDWGEGGKHEGLVGSLEARRSLELMDRFQNADGSWLFGDTLHAALALATLRAIGIPAGDPRAARGLAWLLGQRRRDGDGVWFSIFGSDVWTTAFTLRALLLSGVAGDHPAVTRATAWLLAAQHAEWGFQAGTTTMPDCDDVAVALGPLGIVRSAPSAGASEVRRAVDRATAWLLTMQNADGGWASFQHGLPGKAPGPMMTGPMPTPGESLWDKLRFFMNPPPELGDPSTEDVTGRVLYGLGQNGHTAAEEPIARAIAFLRAQQCESGAWWGRWVVNYLAATAWALRGLAAVGVDHDAPWVRAAIAFILEHQNADGGWGEEVASYRDPRLAGIGATTAGLTGLVLSSLVDAGQARSPAASRATEYLVSRQAADGTWPNGSLLHALVPPDLFYLLPGAPEQLALEALGRIAGAL